MFIKTRFNDTKFIVKMTHEESHLIYEPVFRKFGGVWNKPADGWLFDFFSEEKVEEYIRKQNKQLAEQQNKEYYTKFSDEPDTYNTPSTNSSNSTGLNEAFDLIHELFDRVSDLERIVEEHSRKIKK